MGSWRGSIVIVTRTAASRIYELLVPARGPFPPAIFRRPLARPPKIGKESTLVLINDNKQEGKKHVACRYRLGTLPPPTAVDSANQATELFHWQQTVPGTARHPCWAWPSFGRPPWRHPDSHQSGRPNPIRAKIVARACARLPSALDQIDPSNVQREPSYRLGPYSRVCQVGLRKGYVASTFERSATAASLQSSQHRDPVELLAANATCFTSGDGVVDSAIDFWNYPLHV